MLVIGLKKFNRYF